jgi:hypothetical protein
MQRITNKGNLTSVLAKSYSDQHEECVCALCDLLEDASSWPALMQTAAKAATAISLRMPCIAQLQN